MKRLVPILCVASTSLCLAEATIRVSQGEGGVSYSRIESFPLSDADLKPLRMMATIDITASASNVVTSVSTPVMAQSSHTVCFSTFLTTEADYNFVLDVGGQQTTVSEHIVIPARQRTCVTKQLYKEVSFPGRGNFAYSATSTGSTFSTGKRSTRSDATIFVN